MYAVIRTYQSMSSVTEAGRRAEAGLAAIHRDTPGFKAYYVVDAGEGRAASISLYENHEAAVAASRQGLAWVRTHLSDLYEGDPEIFMGEVVASS